MFRFIDTNFKPEAYEQVENGKIVTLEHLNEALASWVDGYYHRRKHGSTGQTPLERLSKSQRTLRRKTITELTEIFLWEEDRKADKTGCVKLHGNTYEVDLDLAGKQVLLRYDPFNLSVIQVWYQEKRFADATPVDLTQAYHRKFKKIAESKSKSTEDELQISFFDLAEKKRQESWKKEPLNYAGEGIRNE
ncbi:MAG: Mu transposase C-terminal domain-containing protein [Bacillota bacterium]